MLTVKSELYRYEEHFIDEGYNTICGVDEAGRGPLAGPVVAAAVILPKDRIAGIDDSKKLTEKKRELLYPEIIARCKVGVGIATNLEIDELNILQATFLAMRRALADLGTTPDMALVDGNADPHLGIPTRAIVGGDAKSASIGAASIVAKYVRDSMMCESHEIYSEYNFKKHKGYPTKEHYEAITKHGVCPIHRRSFLKTKEISKKTPLWKEAEDIAANRLTIDGYSIIARNYRTKYGEIDIIAQKDGILSFTEVKARGESYLAPPEQAVDASKQKKLAKSALVYLSENSGDLQPRFDVFSMVISGGSELKVKSYEFIESAFDLSNIDI